MDSRLYNIDDNIRELQVSIIIFDYISYVYDYNF